MEYGKLGERNVSRLVYGTLTLGPLQRKMSFQQGADCLLYAYEQGVNAFDTAQYYQTYGYLRLLLKDHPEAVVISKSYAYDRETAVNAVEEAMRELGRDYIDVFLLHEQESEHTIRGHREALDYYLKMKDKGYIGMVGLSTHCVAGVLGAMKYPEIQVIHPMINRGGLGIVDGSREDMERALTQAHTMGKSIYGMKILAGGNYIGEREAAFDYALSLPFLDAMAVGMCSREEIDYNVRYFAGDVEGARQAGADIRDKRLHIEPWCTGCGSCVKRCQQRALTVAGGKCRVDSDRCVLCGYCGGACPEFAIKVI